MPDMPAEVPFVHPLDWFVPPSKAFLATIIKIGNAMQVAVPIIRPAGFELRGGAIFVNSIIQVKLGQFKADVLALFPLWMLFEPIRLHLERKSDVVFRLFNQVEDPKLDDPGLNITILKILIVLPVHFRMFPRLNRLQNEHRFSFNCHRCPFLALSQ